MHDLPMKKVKKSSDRVRNLNKFQPRFQKSESDTISLDWILFMILEIVNVRPTSNIDTIVLANIGTNIIGSTSHWIH